MRRAKSSVFQWRLGLVACGEMKGSAIRKAFLFLSVTVCLVLVPTAAAQASTETILRDCSDNESLDGDYSKSDLQRALGSVPTDLQEYYNCEGLINQALLKKATKRDKLPKGSGNTSKTASADDLTTAAQRKKIKEQVEKESALGAAAPVLGSATSPDIKKAAGQTLASNSAPNVPFALIVAIIGILLLVAVDLAGRLGKIPHVTKLPKTGRRGDG